MTLARALACAIGCALAAFLAGYVIGRHANRSANGLTPHAVTVPHARSALVRFEGGLGCESGENLTLSQWEAMCLGHRLTFSGQTPPQLELPAELLSANPSSITLHVPGWEPLEVKLPALDDRGVGIIASPVVARRETSAFSLNMPRGGSDYDTAELSWVRPLEEQPLASPPAESFSVPLSFAASMLVPSVPTGIYRLVLKSNSPERIRDFTLAPAVAVRAQTRRAPAISIPPSLSRTYVGFAGSTLDQRSTDGPTGFFCGVNVNLKKNWGELALTFQPLHRAQTVRYGNMLPRPDTLWPITNLFLEDPARLAFDCPLSHADHRMILLAVDGRITLAAEPIAPESEQQQTEMLARMKTLIQAQVRKSRQDPHLFDPRYLNLPAEQLPNYDNLASRENFSRHLGRIIRTPVKPLELGVEVTVRRDSDNTWGVAVEP